MDTRYNFKEFESRINERWQQAGVFRPEYLAKHHSEKESQNPFVIVIPPPNVTGVLHMGHALNNSIQDLLVRYYRMQGRPALWVPGTDHAGIATQQVVERELASEGTSRQELGREAFLRRTRELAIKNKKKIIQQLNSLGVSCDWSRERFTLDETLSAAVREVFVRLYEKGLVYRSEYLINWSVGAGTALSDDEVEYREVEGTLYWIHYPFAQDEGGITVATTRPETMLGDTAVAVNPHDERYKEVVGKLVSLPLTDRKIPVIADAHVDADFGTGALKVTPGHAVQDYEIFKRHNIECLNILNYDGSLNANVPPQYRGLPVSKARKVIAAALEEGGYLRKTEPHLHQVGHCYRTATPVEPMLSTQWFVRMETLAEKALDALKTGKIRFYPKRWENTYIHWMRNIRDWCISRQLWWGHRIPVWYDDATGEVIVSRDDPSTLEAHRGKKLRQDEDVLDTWFSSWLWPFTVFGWPEKREDASRFYPTSTLVTAYDIIFFWVARMVMAGLEFTHQVPFRDIFIHGLVRDEKGRKMSKSLGNGIDPLAMVEKYGADALKFTLAFLCKLGGDLPVKEENFQLGSRFANKIWNASRYLLLNLQGLAAAPLSHVMYRSAEKWILYRLALAHSRIQEAMAQYRIDDAAHIVYEYFWWDFCDWYIEISKIDIYSNDEQTRAGIAAFLIYMLEENLKLLHPFLPFITEELYSHLNKIRGRESALLSGQRLEGCPFDIIPAAQLQNPNDREGELKKNAELFLRLQDLVRGMRTLRSEFSLSPKMSIAFYVQAEEDGFLKYLQTQETILRQLTHAASLNIGSAAAEKKGIGVAGRGFLCTVYIAEHIDIGEEEKNIARKKEKLSKKLEQQKKQLANEAFLQKAKPNYVEKIRAELFENQKHIDSLCQIERDLRELR